MEREEHRRRMERDRHEEELRLVRDTPHSGKIFAQTKNISGA